MAKSKDKAGKGAKKRLSVKKQSVKDLAPRGKDVKGGASMLMRRQG